MKSTTPFFLATSAPLLVAGILIVSALPAMACSHPGTGPVSTGNDFFAHAEPTLRDIQSVVRIAMKIFQSPFYLAPLALGSFLIYWKNNAPRFIDALVMGILTSLMMAGFLHLFGNHFLTGACQLVCAQAKASASDPVSYPILVGLTSAMVIPSLLAQATIFAITQKKFGPFYILFSLTAIGALSWFLASFALIAYRISW